MTVLAAITLLVVVSIGIVVLLGGRRIRQLVDVQLAGEGDLPKVTVIVAARNEARNIEAGLSSLCKLDYPLLEIVAVNDRSTDETGEILDRFAKTEPRLGVVHVAELPPRWLGKNHALEIGAKHASGEWLLFSDADVVMEPSVLRHTVGYAIQHDVDHLAVLPQITMPNWFLESFVVTFGLYFNSYIQPWRASDPNSGAHVGVGAFNLLRAEVYRAIGTHRAIAMRPDDDIKLGKLVKNHGFRQEFLGGQELMHVPWYGTLGEMIVGLEKNMFSGVDYKVWVIVASSLLALAMHVWPFVAVFATSGLTRWLYAAVAIWMLLLCYATAAVGGQRRWTIIAFPVTVLVFVFIQWRSMFLTFWNNGIRWRDTHYPLSELKENRV